MPNGAFGIPPRVVKEPVHLQRHAANQGVPPIRPYENFSTTRTRLIPDLRAFVDTRLAEGFFLEGAFLASLQPPVPWDDFPRNCRARLHAWEPISILLSAHSRFGDEKYFSVAADFAFDWLARFQVPALSRLPADLLAEETDGESFVWYDMCVAQRLYRLAYMAETIIRLGERSIADRQLALAALEFHHKVLAEDTIFRRHTNHGIYQALGQLAASRRLNDLIPSERYALLARKRLDITLAEHFVPDEGIHREHSPFYQHILLHSLLGAKDAGLLDSAEAGFLDRVEESIVWMILPDATLATFGDSDRILITEDAPIDQVSDPALRYLLSGGSLGERPPSGVQAFSRGGYAFARIYDREGGEDPTVASYLAQLAAFHSRVHKHADHLTFIWSEGELPILIDPGRYGYLGRTTRGDGLFEQGFWYSDPKRIYVESTRAHNCVEIDGRSYLRQKNRAFGSALKQAALQDGLVVFDTAVVHRPSLLHRRTLILAPREFLLVIDWLFDRSGAPHDFRQWFQLAPGWETERRSGSYSARRGDAELSIVDLLGAAASPVYVGSQEPFQGWTADQPGSLTPSPSLNFARQSTARAAFATLFSLQGEAVADARTRVNSSLSRGVLAWQVAGRTTRLELAREERVTLRRSDSHAHVRV
jgi:hypothetical protein